MIILKTLNFYKMTSQETKNKLAGTKTTNLDGGRTYLVDAEVNQPLYDQITGDELIIPAGYVIVAKDDEDVQVVLGTGSVFSEAVVLGGGGSGEAVTWATLSGKPATFPPTIGSTATTAMAGNTSIPTASSTAPAALATTAAVGTGTTWARADHVHARPTGAQVLATGYTIGTAGAVAAADSINAAIGKLEARIVALETP